MYLKLFHLTVFALDVYAIWYDQMYVDMPFPSKQIKALPLKARPIFMTFWCLVLQTIYFGTTVLNDLIGTNAANPKKPPLIRKIKDIIFSQALPVAIYVSAIFWIMYYINKDLIFPDVVEKIMPKWLNHTMHTLITPFIFIELFATKRNYPSRKKGILFMTLFTCTYTTWLHVVYFQTGTWAYPFLKVFSWPMRIMFCTSSILFSFVIYIVGEKINYFVTPKVEIYSNGKSH